MKLNFHQSNVHEMIGMGEAQVSQMKSSPLAFDILSKRIYKNKVKAPIQELACNAKDAHVMAGTPNRPIEVKLPNTIDAEFYVKDWGPGLSEDEVKNLYMTYFLSTKSASDEFTGAFGLGSKSPFCYVDQFWVTSAQDGVQTTYLAFRNNQGLPSITKVQDSTQPAPADWQHGLRVGFPAATEDFARFAEEAANVFRWFDVQPEVRGAYHAQVNAFAYEDEHFAVLAAAPQPRHNPYRYRQYGSGSPSYVRMGSVGYLIEMDNLEGLLSDERKALLQSGLVLNMPIGSVSVTASRESLEYDPQTLAALGHQLDIVIETLTSLAAQAVGTRSKDRALNQVLEALAPFRLHLTHPVWTAFFAKAVRARLMQQDPAFDLTEALVNDLLTAKTLSFPASVGTTATVGVTVFEANRHGDFTQKTVQAGKTGNGTAVLTLTNGATAVVVEDVSYASNRCKAALESRQYGDLILVSGKDKASKLATAQQIAAFFCNIPVVMATTLPKGKEPVRMAKSSGAVGRQKIDDRLGFFENEPVVLLGPDGAAGFKRTTVPLKEAVEKTRAYLLANFTSDYARSPHTEGRGSFGFDQVGLMLRGVQALHPSFVADGLGHVMLLSSSLIQKLRAKDALLAWDSAVADRLQRHGPDIAEQLRALPGYLTGMRKRSYHTSGTLPDFVRNPMVEHLCSWVHDDRVVASFGNKVPAIARFQQALQSDLRDVIAHLLAALGYQALDGQKTWGVSPSEHAWLGLYYLAQLLTDSRALVQQLTDSLAAERDEAFHKKVGAHAAYFAALDKRNEFLQLALTEPVQAAQVYNALWQLGAADASGQA